MEPPGDAVQEQPAFSAAERIEAEMRPLARAELPADTVALARFLLGATLVRVLGGETLAGRIVETEAYLPDDAASHAFRGRTARNASMFLERGHAYVYISYGCWPMLNVASEEAGVGAGVLIRALEPLEGAGSNARQSPRRGEAARFGSRVQGRLAVAMAITLAEDGWTCARPAFSSSRVRCDHQWQSGRAYASASPRRLSGRCASMRWAAPLSAARAICFEPRLCLNVRDMLPYRRIRDAVGRDRPAPNQDCVNVNFSFLHAADLHLGSPFIGLAGKDSAVAERFATASRDAFSDLVSLAIEREVAFVIVAGDVYDREWKDTSIGLFFNREIARLDREGIRVFLLKGNHDAASVVTRTISLPACVSVFSATKAETFTIPDLGVALHGRSFPDREVPENYALTYPDPASASLNIGVLHTSCDGRPGHASYAPCSAADSASRGYDYWALGHVHQFEVIAEDPWIVFPGNLQGRSVRECGPKGAVIVDVADGAVTGIRHVALDRARWAELSIALDGIDKEHAALGLIEERTRAVVDAAGARPVALRVRLTGETRLDRSLRADPRRFADEVQAAAHRAGEDVWLERVKLDTSAPRQSDQASPALLTLDIAAMLDGLERDPAVRAQGAELIAAVLGKLPGGMETGHAPLSDELDALLDEARDLLLGRVPQATC
jgi:DNA-3-methyladenine glycosylase